MSSRKKFTSNEVNRKLWKPILYVYSIHKWWIVMGKVQSEYSFRVVKFKQILIWPYDCWSLFFQRFEINKTFCSLKMFNFLFSILCRFHGNGLACWENKIYSIKYEKPDGWFHKKRNKLRLSLNEWFRNEMGKRI